MTHAAQSDLDAQIADLRQSLHDLDALAQQGIPIAETQAAIQERLDALLAQHAAGDLIRGDQRTAIDQRGQQVETQINVAHLYQVYLGAGGTLSEVEVGALLARYLTELAHDANRLPWTVVEQEYAHPERGQGLGLAEVYTALDTTELEPVAREEDLRRFLA